MTRGTLSAASQKVSLPCCLPSLPCKSKAKCLGMLRLNDQRLTRLERSRQRGVIYTGVPTARSHMHGMTVPWSHMGQFSQLWRSTFLSCRELCHGSHRKKTKTKTQRLRRHDQNVPKYKCVSCKSPSDWCNINIWRPVMDRNSWKDWRTLKICMLSRVRLFISLADACEQKSLKCCVWMRCTLLLWCLASAKYSAWAELHQWAH